MKIATLNREKKDSKILKLLTQKTKNFNKFIFNGAMIKPKRILKDNIDIKKFNTSEKYRLRRRITGIQIKMTKSASKNRGSQDDYGTPECEQSYQEPGQSFCNEKTMRQ